MKRSPRRLAAATLLLCLSPALASCGGDDETADDTGSSSDAGSTACSYEEGGQAAKDVDLPSSDASDSGTAEVVLATNVGDVTATLDREAAPCTVNSFLSLAEQGYFDDTPCHRITTPEGFQVLQCGDPTGTGAGGPGYSFADELSGQESYPAGTLAMANAGPDTNGSQFFVVYGDTDLPPSYTVFGTVDDKSVATLAAFGKKQAAAGVQDGAPTEPVVISSVEEQ